MDYILWECSCIKENQWSCCHYGGWVMAACWVDMEMMIAPIGCGESAMREHNWSTVTPTVPNNLFTLLHSKIAQGFGIIECSHSGATSITFIINSSVPCCCFDTFGWDPSSEMLLKEVILVRQYFLCITFSHYISLRLWVTTPPELCLKNQVISNF